MSGHICWVIVVHRLSRIARLTLFYSTIFYLKYMELALIFAPSGATIEALHIWSEENSLADALSRLGEGAALPDVLAKVPRTRACDEGWHIIGRTTAPPRRPSRV